MYPTPKQYNPKRVTEVMTSIRGLITPNADMIDPTSAMTIPMTPMLIANLVRLQNELSGKSSQILAL
jgi:hypothetical protein